MEENLHKKHDQTNSQASAVAQAEMAKDISYMRQAIDKILERLDSFPNTYVSKEELAAELKSIRTDIQAVDAKYATTRALVSGFVGLVLTTVISALLYLVIIKQ